MPTGAEGVTGVRVELSRDEGVRLAHAADASGLQLIPDAVARPESAAEVAELLRQAAAERTPVTAAGAQSSTTAASITDRGTLLSLRGLNRVLDLDTSGRTVWAEAGVLLGALKRTVAEHGLLLAPDPTSEEECTVGGAVACNASGARTLRYGATRAHVVALRVALLTGETVELRRPRLEKNTVGYTPVHDPVDWFVGSEGTLGIVTAAQFRLLPRPATVVGLGLPFRTEADALAFVVAARESVDVHPQCLEFFDQQALAIFRAAGDEPAWAADAGALVYAEQAGAGDDADLLDAWLLLAEEHGALTDDARAFQGDAALRQARRMRHAVPATMNERGARCRPAGGRKVSTDWAVPYPRLADALRQAREIASRHEVPQAVAYGHAGNGHPHQNFIAHDARELQRIEGVVEETLRVVLAMGGTVAAEHGIGKIKRRWLPLQLSPMQLGMMRAIKRELDPHGLLAPGNVL